MRKQLWSENLKGRDHMLKKQDVRVWTGFMWLQTGSDGGLLTTLS
jgi:hypothetical protein